MGNSLLYRRRRRAASLAIGSLTTFRHLAGCGSACGWMLTNAALLTYVIPLFVPRHPVLPHHAELRARRQSALAVIAVEVTFATPYAIFIFQQYSASIPLRAGRGGAHRRRFAAADLLPHLPAADGAGAGRDRHLCAAAGMERISLRVPAAVLDATITVPVALGKFLSSDEAPWNYLMAAAIIYAHPAAVIYYVFRRKMTTGLTMGGVKG